LVPRDEASVWAWLPLGRNASVAWEPLYKAVDDADPGPRLAAGAPAPGVEGFRRTHQQALLAQALATAAGRDGSRTTVFAEDAPGGPRGAGKAHTRPWG